MLVLEKQNTRNREAMIVSWYEEIFPLAAAHVRKRGGDLEDAKEVFQQAVMLYYEKLVNQDFQPEAAEGAYLMGIVKNRWLKHMEKSSRTDNLEHQEVIEENVQQPLTDKLLRYLNQAGAKCMDLLQSFYYEQLTMNQLASRFGYTSERSATVQKYKCLEKVRDEIKQKSLTYEDFLD